MDRITTWLRDTVGLSDALQNRLFASIVAVAIFWAVRRIVLAIIWRHVIDAPARYRIRKTTMYITVSVGLVVVGRIWFQGLQSLATFLGLVSAGLAIALKDLVVNLAGWGFILWRRPFELGDRIEIGHDAGDVIDIRIFQFTLMEIGNWVDAEQSTGRIIHVPNGKLLTEVLANYSKGFQYIWNEIPVLVTFESNWKKAKEILGKIVEDEAARTAQEPQKRVEEASRKFLISFRKLTPTVYTSVIGSGVLLTMRYLCMPRGRRGSSQTVWEAVLEAFDACDDIDFAYPTQRLYLNQTEGKPGARAAGSPFPQSPDPRSAR